MTRPAPPADATLAVHTPAVPAPEAFTDAAAAVARLRALHTAATDHLAEGFARTLRDGHPVARYRAFYPEVRLTTTSFAAADRRLSFGHVTEPGSYATTITRPDLFRAYLEQQIGLLLRNHGVPVVIGASTTPIPIHFALAGRPDTATLPLLRAAPKPASDHGPSWPASTALPPPDCPTRP